jgi:hypothetical protein
LFFLENRAVTSGVLLRSATPEHQLIPSIKGLSPGFGNSL